jgi:hypothetical protein
MQHPVLKKFVELPEKLTTVFVPTLDRMIHNLKGIDNNGVLLDNIGLETTTFPDNTPNVPDLLLDFFYADKVLSDLMYTNLNLYNKVLK